MAYTIVKIFGPLLDHILEDIQEKDGKTDLILVVSQMEILLETSNTSVSCR